jgi:hypothetical protein
MTNKLTNSPRLKRVLAEPTSFFAIIAAAIFGFYALNQTSEEYRLEIDQREIDARLFLQEVANGAELTPLQKQQATNAYIEEQILVKQALAMGLDNDTRIHTILAQKVRHVLSGDVIQPAANELDAFYQTHADKYRSLPTVSVNELIFNTKAELNAAVQAGLATNASGDALLELEAGSISPLPRVSHLDLANIFSEGFADSVFGAENGAWTGPFLSNRGQHWLQIFQRSPARLPDLNEIIDLVRLDWITIEEDRRLDLEIAELSSKYDVVIINDPQ